MSSQQGGTTSNTLASGSRFFLNLLTKFTSVLFLNLTTNAEVPSGIQAFRTLMFERVGGQSACSSS